MRSVRRMIFWCAALTMLGTSLPARAQTTQDYTSQLMPFAQANIVAAADGFRDRYGNPATINLAYARADFQGTGQFGYFVVGYWTADEGAVRLLELSDGQFHVVNDPLPSTDASPLDIELRDVNNDGVPEVRVDGYGADTDYGLWVLKWNGSGLQDITPQGTTYDGFLYDVDHDGTLDIVAPPPCPTAPGTHVPENCGDPYTVYKYNAQAGKYGLEFTSPTDPTGMTPGAANGELAVSPRTTLIDPSHFPLAEIQRVAQGLGNEGGAVTVRLGNLREWVVGAPPQPVDVTDVDTSSLVLGADIRPLTVIVVPPSGADQQQQGSGNGRPSNGSANFQGAFLQLQFDRGAVLAFLPRVHLDKPLVVGETLEVPLRGKMMNGVLLEGGVTVRIVGASADAE